MTNKAAVIFNESNLPSSRECWKRFDTVVAPKNLENLIEASGVSFVSIENFIAPGNIEEASRLVRELSLIKTSNGIRLSSSVMYKGYELWWMHYDDLMYRFCVPYMQYEGLLDYLKQYSEVYLHNPPLPDLFKYFFEAHGSKVLITSEFDKKLPLGIVLQVAISIPFILWLKIKRPEILLWSSDLFDPPRDHDFRLRFIYEELRKKGVRFAEFIRSMEPSKTVLEHAWARKRPVVYSFAIGRLAHYIGCIFGNRKRNNIRALAPHENSDPMDIFKFKIASAYLEDAKGDIFAIRTIGFVMRFLNIKAAIITAAISRNFHEVIATKINGIPTVGILHGMASKDYNVYDFMPEYEGEKSLSVDKYGVWSEWWKEYYVKNSKAYKPEQLHVSGPIRPLQKQLGIIKAHEDENGPIRVLFISEQLAAPEEIMPCLRALLADKSVSLYFKFRSYKDGFEAWIRENHPEILDGFKEEKIFRGSMPEAIEKCDVVVGSHSTAVLEALLQHKPFVLFYTRKWGDYFDLRASEYSQYFFAENPDDLLEKVGKSKQVPDESVREMQERFFGDPYQNGSKWVVDEIEELLWT